MDIFYCDPLETTGETREQWVKELSKWQDFSRAEIKFYEAQGKFQEMLDPKHVVELQRVLREVLANRGV
jgi:thioesterase domain-containing protein